MFMPSRDNDISLTEVETLIDLHLTWILTGFAVPLSFKV